MKEGESLELLLFGNRWWLAIESGFWVYLGQGGGQEAKEVPPIPMSEFIGVTGMPTVGVIDFIEF